METTHAAERGAAGEEQFAAELLERVRVDERVLEQLPGGGVLHLDRRLPYIVVYRMPLDRTDAGTRRLIRAEASYAIVPDAGSDAFVPVLRAIVEAGSTEFGAFLLLELWSGEDGSREFRIHCPRGEGAETVAALSERLHAFAVEDIGTEVVVEATIERHPPGATPLLTPAECKELGCLSLGLEVPPLYRGADDAVYPVFFRAFRRQLSRVLRQAIHEFVRVQTTAGIENYRMLGPSRIDADALAADREVAAIEESYQFLLLVSPVNEVEAAAEFSSAGYEREPELHYRLLPVDPDLLKRRLFAIPLEQIEDPAMGYLLRDKREELDRQISMLGARGSADFRICSLRLFGALEPALLRSAREILAAIPRASGSGGDASPVDARAFAERARLEIERYRRVDPQVASTVEILDDMTGLMVSRGHLLIGKTLRLRADRVEPLIHHEVGTHVLTFCNGAAQPLGQLRYGLADYDELQEGLAVLAEYLVDGLSRARLRLLAARVIAVHAMLEGASFVETFRLLREEYEFSGGAAFSVTTRVHQGGGFTRDMIYLRGLLRLMEYLAEGGALEPLYIGKIALKHLPVLEELRDRRVLREPPLRPAFLDVDGARDRLDAVRGGLPVTGLVRGAQT